MEWLTYGAYMISAAYGVEKIIGLSNKIVKQKEMKKIENSKKTRIFDEETVYELLICLCKQIQYKEECFTPSNEYRNAYFENFQVGNWEEAEFYMEKGEGKYHLVSVNVMDRRVMYFEFYPDGTIKNIEFVYCFLKKENADYFMNELKKTMREFLNMHGNKVTDNFEFSLEQDQNWNVTFVDEEMNEKLISIYDIHGFLLSKKEALSTEQLHEMEKILHERVRPLLTHYEALSEETKEEKKEDVSKALDRAYNTLHTVQEQYEHTHKLALEKQLQLLK